MISVAMLTDTVGSLHNRRLDSSSLERLSFIDSPIFSLTSHDGGSRV